MLAKIKALAATVWADLVDTYNRTKIYILGLLVILVYIKFNEIKEALLAYAGKKEIESDQKKDAVLATTVKTDSDAADALVKQAQELADQPQPTIADGWNLKK
jgi:hypothetical protein